MISEKRLCKNHFNLLLKLSFVTFSNILIQWYLKKDCVKIILILGVQEVYLPVENGVKGQARSSYNMFTYCEWSERF